MLVHRGKQGINKKNKTKNNPKQMRLWQTPGVIYQSQNTEPREVTNGWSTGVCTPLHRSLLFKRRGGISRAERGPFLGSFLLSGRREGSAFGWNCPKRLQSGSLGAKARASRVASRQCCLGGTVGSGAAVHSWLACPHSPPSRQQRCPRRGPCKPRFGEQHHLTYLGAVFQLH